MAGYVGIWGYYPWGGISTNPHTYPYEYINATITNSHVYANKYTYPHTFAHPYCYTILNTNPHTAAW